MTDGPLLTTLIAARRGDEAAAAKLYQLYIPQLQRVIRFQLRDRRLRRQIDSDDLCQSVFGDFFTRLRLGQYDIASPEQLSALLAVMARNKLLHQVERSRAARRDIYRTAEGDVSQVPLLSEDTTPSERASRNELIAEFRLRLTPGERWIAERRAAGDGWDALAAELKEAPDTLRMRFIRTIDRIAEELGI